VKLTSEIDQGFITTLAIWACRRVLSYWISIVWFSHILLRPIKRNGGL